MRRRRFAHPNPVLTGTERPVGEDREACASGRSARREDGIARSGSNRDRVIFPLRDTAQVERELQPVIGRGGDADAVIASRRFQIDSIGSERLLFGARYKHDNSEDPGSDGAQGVRRPDGYKRVEELTDPSAEARLDGRYFDRGMPECLQEVIKFLKLILAIGAEQKMLFDANRLLLRHPTHCVQFQLFWFDM